MLLCCLTNHSFVWLSVRLCFVCVDIRSIARLLCCLVVCVRSFDQSMHLSFCWLYECSNAPLRLCLCGLSCGALFVGVFVRVFVGLVVCVLVLVFSVAPSLACQLCWLCCCCCLCSCVRSCELLFAVLHA